MVVWGWGSSKENSIFLRSGWRIDSDLVNNPNVQMPIIGK